MVRKPPRVKTNIQGAEEAAQGLQEEGLQATANA